MQHQLRFASHIESRTCYFATSITFEETAHECHLVDERRNSLDNVRTDVHARCSTWPWDEFMQELAEVTEVNRVTLNSIAMYRTDDLSMRGQQFAAL